MCTTYIQQCLYIIQHKYTGTQAHSDSEEELKSTIKSGFRDYPCASFCILYDFCLLKIIENQTNYLCTNALSIAWIINALGMNAPFIDNMAHVLHDMILRTF